MLSYPWAHQQTMLMVKQWLVEAGYKVWMDVDQMQGSILEAMAGAVEDSACVVVCMCSEYKESNACRTEGEYAYRLNKPIIPIRPVDYTAQGWLGALLGNKLYFDFSATVASGNQLAKQDMGTKEAFLAAVRRESSGSGKPAAVSAPATSTPAATSPVRSTPAASAAPAVSTSHAHGSSALTTGETQILEKLSSLETLVKLQSSEIMELKSKVTSGGGSGLSDNDRAEIQRIVAANSGCCIIS
jgi:hypothetical protein